MKCQNCGFELAQDEVFCGQCGAQQVAPAQATEMIPAPPPNRSGLLGGYQGGAFSPTSAGQSLPPENVATPGKSAVSQPNQMGGFYQDSTEAYSMVPGTPANYPPGSYPQQGFSMPGGPMPGGYNTSGQFGPQGQQPFPTGNYPPNQSFPTQMGMTSGQFGQVPYGGSGINPAPEKRSNALMVVGIVCLVFAIITVGVVGALFALRSGSSNQNQSTPTAVVQATTAPTPTDTPIPSPTATSIPSPTAVPTPAPDPNFSWCGTQCTQAGFQVEYPNGWGQAATIDGDGIQFGDPSQSDIYAAFKNPSSNATSAADLINADIQEFSSKPNYAGPQGGEQTTTIGGVLWSYETISYQNNGQMEQVVIYATIYQSKDYLIELEAPQSQFTTMQQYYFNLMIGRFQFVAATQ